jgi:hypothetical protein
MGIDKYYTNYYFPAADKAVIASVVPNVKSGPTSPAVSAQPDKQVAIVAEKAPVVADECRKETTMRVDTLIVNKAEVKEAKIDKAHIEKAKINKAKIEKAKIKTAKIEKAEIKTAEIETANVKTANIETANVKTANIETANVKTANVETVNIKTVPVKVSGPAVKVEPLVTLKERASFCDQKGGCYQGKVLTGRYFTLDPYQNVRLVSNTGNQRYPDNSISFKIEYHKAGHIGWPYGNDWGPTIVIRNPTMERPIELASVNANRILPYLERITALKKGQSGNEGDSCFEVVLLRDGTIYRDESPAEARFRK